MDYPKRISRLALAVTGDGNIDQLGDSDDGNLGVQDDAEKKIKLGTRNIFGFKLMLDYEWQNDFLPLVDWLTPPSYVHQFENWSKYF